MQQRLYDHIEVMAQILHKTLWAWAYSSEKDNTHVIDVLLNIQRQANAYIKTASWLQFTNLFILYPLKVLWQSLLIPRKNNASILQRNLVAARGMNCAGELENFIFLIGANKNKFPVLYLRKKKTQTNKHMIIHLKKAKGSPFIEVIV